MPTPRLTLRGFRSATNASVTPRMGSRGARSTAPNRASGAAVIGGSAREGKTRYCNRGCARLCTARTAPCKPFPALHRSMARADSRLEPAPRIPPVTALRTVARIGRFLRPYRRQVVYASIALVFAAAAVLLVGQGLEFVLARG